MKEAYTGNGNIAVALHHAEEGRRFIEDRRHNKHIDGFILFFHCDNFAIVQRS